MVTPHGVSLGSLYVSLGANTAGLIDAKKEIINLNNMMQAQSAMLNSKLDGMMAAASKSVTKTAKTTLESFQTSLAAVGARMQNFGRSATMYLTVPMALAGGAILKSAKDFEIAMQHIVGLVGVSQNQVNQWSRDILSLSPQIARPPKELAEALYFVTSSGIKGAAALDVVKQSAKGAAAGLGETMAVADLVTSAMNAYKNSGLTATRSLDILTAAVREGKGEAAAFATQMGEVIPIAAKMGVSFDQVAAGMSAMTLTGTNVSESATYMRQILVSLLDPAKESENALRAMGTSGSELRKIIREQGLLAALTKLNNLTNKYGEDMMSRVFPNVRALTGVLSLMGNRLEENRGLFERVNNSTGDMERAFQSVTDTIDFKYNRALTNIKVAAIEVGMSLKESVIPILDGLGNTVRNLANWYTNLSSVQKRLILDIGMLLTVIGPLSISISVMAKVFANTITLVGQATKAFSVLKVVMMETPFGLLAVGITAAIIALNNWNKSTDRFKTIQGSVNTQISEEVFQLNSVFERLKNVNLSNKERSETLNTVNQRYGTYLTNLLTEKSTLQDIEKAQKQATNALIAATAIKAYRTALEDEIGAISKAYSNSFSDFVSGFTQTYGGDRLVEFLQRIFKEADMAVMMKDATFGAVSIWDDYVEAISKKTGYLKYSFEDWSKAFSEFVVAKSEHSTAVDQINEMIKAYEKLIGTKEEIKKISGGGSGGSGGGKNTTQEEINLNDKMYRSMMDTTFAATVHQESLGKLDMEMYESVLVGEKLQKELGWIAYQNSFMGDSFDQTSERVRVLREMIKTLYDQQQKDPTKQNAENLKNFVRLLQQANIEQINTNLQKELDSIAFKTSFMGDSFDATSAKVNAYETAIQELYALQLKDPSIENTENLKKLIAQYTILADKQKENAEAQKLGNKLAKEFANELQGDISSINDFANALRDAAISAISSWVAQIITKQIFNSVQSTKNPYAALAVSAIITAATKAMLNNAIPKLAEGGTVPPGYPNDSYPAFLTSGEKIVPPQKLDTISRSDDKWNSEVEFRIRGDELYGVLKKHSTKLKIL